jgi:hypothetical protein
MECFDRLQSPPLALLAFGLRPRDWFPTEPLVELVGIELDVPEMRDIETGLTRDVLRSEVFREPPRPARGLQAIRSRTDHGPSAELTPAREIQGEWLRRVNGGSISNRAGNNDGTRSWRKFEPAVLFAGYLIVTLLPLGLAPAGARPPHSVWDELASGASVLAFSIMLREFVLSGRIGSMSGRIGMDLTMRLHQLLGRTALVLALVHPFLYKTCPNPPLPWDSTRQLTIVGELEPLLGGMLAWILLPSLILLAIGRTKISYRYETWRLMHGIGALAVAALILH